MPRHHPRTIAAALVLLVAGLGSDRALAWADHSSLLWPLVRTVAGTLYPTLQPEPLDEFVAAEAEGIEKVLEAHEAWARSTLPEYAPRPDAIAFRADAPDLRGAFLRAIRVNPEVPYALYRRWNAGEALPAPEQRLSHSAVSNLPPGIVEERSIYIAITAKDRLSPAQVLASANEEPDLGMDVGLFANNGTAFGASYGFGSQPFGNPKLPYGSQAPFHMGFYHLDWLISVAQPDLLRTFPDWRVSLYEALSRHAFESGHAYWGWRFSGWALHYIGDLTQPYHAQPLPGIGTWEALWLVLTGGTDDAVQLVSNRHGVLESYQYERVYEALADLRWGDPIVKAIASGGAKVVYTTHTLRDQLTVGSVAAAEALDAVLEAHVPARLVSDPSFEWTGSPEEAAIVSLVRNAGGDRAITGLDAAVVTQMYRFSRFARAWIERSLKMAGDTGSSLKFSDSLPVQ